MNYFLIIEIPGIVRSRCFEENEKGRIAPGMAADFVVLDSNPFEVPAGELARIRVEATYVNGVCCYASQERD